MLLNIWRTSIILKTFLLIGFFRWTFHIQYFAFLIISSAVTYQVFFPLNKCDIFNGYYLYTLKISEELISQCRYNKQLWLYFMSRMQRPRFERNMFKNQSKCKIRTFNAFPVDYVICFTRETDFFIFSRRASQSWHYKKSLVELKFEHILYNSLLFSMKPFCL